MKFRPWPSPSLLVYWLLCWQLTGCGYFSDEEKAAPKLNNTDSLISCKLQSRNLTRIFEKDIKKEILCIKENLKAFNKYVKRENLNYILRHDISRFIEKFFYNQREVFLKSLNLAFEVNKFFSDEYEKIPISHIDGIIHALIILNQESATIRQIFEQGKKSSPKELEKLASSLEKSLKELQNHFLPAIQHSIAEGQEGKNIQIKNFIEKIQQLFLPEVAEIDQKSLDTLLNFKRLFLGGNKEEVTLLELQSLLQKAPALTSMGLRLYFTSLQKPSSPSAQNALYRTYQKELAQLPAFFHPHPPETSILQEEEVGHLIDTFGPDWQDRAFFKSLLHFVKTHLIDGEKVKSDIYTLGNIRILLKLADVSLNIARFQNRIKPLMKDLAQASPAIKARRRISFLKESSLLAKELQKNWTMPPFFPSSSINLESLNDFAQKHQKKWGFTWKESWFDSFRMAKKILVGGEGNVTYFTEWGRPLSKLPLLAEVFFDLYTLDLSDLGEKKLGTILKTLFLTVEKIKVLTYFDDPERLLFSNRDLLLMGKLWRPDQQFLPLLPSLNHLKKALLGGRKDHYNAYDFLKLLDLAKGFLVQMWFFDTRYDFYQKEMRSEQQIDQLPMPPPAPQQTIGPDLQKRLHQDFLALVKNHRFYRNQDGRAFYGPGLQRNKNGFMEIAALRWGFQKLAPLFGHFDEKTNSYLWNLDEVKFTLNTFLPVLQFFDFAPQSIERSASDLLFFSDLFQTQSNGNLQVSPIEMSDFGINFLQAIKLGKEIQGHLQKKCPLVPIIDGYGYQIDCFRTNFFPALLDQMNFKQQAPKIDHWYKNTHEEKIIQFIKSIENITRTQGSAATIGQTEINSIIGAILNIESLYTRFDSNHDNWLDYQELLPSYELYKKALIQKANLGEDQIKYANVIYFYVLENMSLPGKWEIFWHYYGSFWQNRSHIKVGRFNIAVLLDHLANQKQQASQQKAESGFEKDF